MTDPQVFYNKEDLWRIPSLAQATQGKEDRSVKALVEQAAQHYSRAENAPKQGDWSGYGEEIKRLGQVLESLSKSRVNEPFAAAS